MKSFIKKRLGNHVKDQQGFTLIEMLVVIGIIVALAAVIVPLVIQFSGDGASASQQAEWDAVQTTIDTMMVDNELNVVTAGGGTFGARITDTGTQFDSAINLVDYTRDPVTNYCYTWDTTGRLLAQFDWDPDLAVPACVAFS